MIHTLIPFAPAGHDGDLGWAYRKALSLVPAGDWALFLDHDVAWTTRCWYPQIERAIRDLKGEKAVLIPTTNRCGGRQQIAPGAPEGHDLEKHRAFGQKLSQQPNTLKPITEPFSGYAFCFPKEVGEDVGFGDGLVGVDTQFARRCFKRNIPIYLMTACYIYHFYRADGVSVIQGFEQQRSA